MNVNKRSICVKSHIHNVHMEYRHVKFTAQQTWSFTFKNIWMEQFLLTALYDFNILLHIVISIPYRHLPFGQAVQTIILPIVLYGCETWSLTLREERRLRVFENRVLRTVFGPKRDEVTGEWRKLHNEELSDLYSLPNIVRVVKWRRMRWACMGEGRGVHRVLVGKPEGKGKRPSGRPRCRWEDNITRKMDLQEVGGGCEDWMELAEDRDRWRALVSMVMNLRVPKMRGISWPAAEPISFPRRTLLHGVSK